MFQLVHEIPGRLRLRAASLRRDPRAAGALAAQLRAMPGVLAAEVNPRTGSLLIRHDAAPGRAAALLSRFAPVPAPPEPIGRLAEAVMDRAVERLLTALVAALL